MTRWVVALAALLPMGGCRDKPVPIVVESAPPAPAPTPTAPRDTHPRARPRVPAEKSGISDSDRFDDIRRGLRALVVAEQGYFAENGVYTEDFDRIGFRPPAKIKYRFLYLTRDGWAVSGTHADVPGRECLIWVGVTAKAPTTANYGRGAPEGVPVCDLPSSPPGATSSTGPVVRPGDTASAMEAVSPFIQMRVDLRNLVRSQEAYLATQGLYSRRFEPFALQYFWHRGVTIRILSADNESWAAKATHRTQPGKSCVVYFGPVPLRPTTSAQKKTPDHSAVPVCDD
jgi:hypothetical protein